MPSINELEDHAKKLKVLVDQAKMAERLANNRDFRKLILEDYCRDEAVRTLALAVSDNLTQAQRDDALQMALSTARLREHLTVLGMMGRKAENDLKQTLEALDELRGEEVEDAGDPA